MVDDEPTLAELLASTLRFAGFAVTSAASGAEALAAAEEATPDLVLLDVMLPDIDGFDVLRQLRGQRLPVRGGSPVTCRSCSSPRAAIPKTKSRG